MKRGAYAGWVGLAACGVATLLALVLHGVYLTHAGALWRDEAGGVQLAALPDLGMTCRPAREWFPVCFFALVRCWSALGLGDSDFSLRVLGFLVGLGLLGALWFNARLMQVRWPVVSLGLLAANATVIRWGDSLRAYGCGALFILLTLGLVWRLVRKPGGYACLLACLAAVLSVQTLYPNAFLVLAACVAGGAVCARRGDWKGALLVLAVGGAAAVSLLPYVPVLLASREYMALHQMGFSADIAWNSLAVALGSGQGWPLWVWAAVAALVFGVAWETLLERRHCCRQPEPETQSRQECRRSDRAWYGISALVLGIASFFVFLRMSGIPAEPWYFLPLMVYAAAALDATLADWFERFGPWPVLVAALLAGAMFPATLTLAKARQTNVDLVAAELHQSAKPGDYVVVSPAYCGISFARYYRGPAAWTTLPPVEDHRSHRVDLLKANLGSRPLLKSVLDQVERTLAGGGAVWVVGALSPPEPGEVEPPELPPDPPPGQPYGWAEGCARGYIWDRQVAYLLETRAQELVLVQGPSANVNPLENLPLFKAAGVK